METAETRTAGATSRTARELRVRAFALGVQIKDLAAAIDRSVGWTSNVLAGNETSPSLLREVERYLDQVEAQQV